MNRLARFIMTVGAFGIAWSAVCDSHAVAQQNFRYHYVSLNATVPDDYHPFVDFPQIINDGRVYGTIYGIGGNAYTSAVVVYDHGTMAIIHEGFAPTANNSGVAGGAVTIDPIRGSTQAALFRGSKVSLIPSVTDAYLHYVIMLADSGIALVEWYPEDFSTVSRYLYFVGRSLPINVGPSDMNAFGLMAGTTSRPEGFRAFRYNPFLSKQTLLSPLPTEPNAYGEAINSRGDVLGYSFRACGIERIGVWRGTKFQTYFVEGTPEFPIVSNDLLWNERGLIIITTAEKCGIGTDLNSYIVPRPGVRLNLADLTDAPLPVWTSITDVNERGDIVGWGGPQPFVIDTSFLLKRVLSDKDDAESGGSSAMTQAATFARGAAQRPMALEHSLRERLHRAILKGAN